MKAWLIESAGDIDKMFWGDIPDVHAENGQIVIKVMSTALNPVDYQVIESSGNKNWSYPHYAGVDVAGVVTEIGDNVTNFKIGDAIACHMDLNKKGSFTEYTAVGANTAAKIPENVSFDQAAAILCAGLTAYQTIYQKLNTSQKKNILIHGGAGGVGSFAIQLAKELGLKVITTASQNNHAWLKELGADVVIDYKTESVTERIKEETDGNGVDLIFNTISKDEATKDLDRLAFSGQLAYIAGAPDLTNVKPFSLSPSIHEVALGAAYSAGTLKAKQNLSFMTNEMLQKVAQGSLDPMVSKILSKEDLPAGLKELKKRHVRGKIIVNMQS